MSDNISIFDALEQINRRNYSWFLSLTDKQQKGLAPIVLARWLSGSSSTQVLIVDEVLNPYVFSLYKHPYLLWLLMCTCSVTKYQRYNWIKKTATSTNHPKSIGCIQQYFGYSITKAKQVFNTINKDDILLMADDMGYDQHQLNEISYELGGPVVKKTTKKKPPATDKVMTASSMDTGFIL